jgi:hypothetical protein
VQGWFSFMSERYLAEEELYELITRTPPLSKRTAINFIESYGAGRVIDAFEDIRKSKGVVATAEFNEKELDARFERVSLSMNELLHSLAGAFSDVGDVISMGGYRQTK